MITNEPVEVRALLRAARAYEAIPDVVHLQLLALRSVLTAPAGACVTSNTVGHANTPTMYARKDPPDDAISRTRESDLPPFDA